MRYLLNFIKNSIFLTMVIGQFSSVFVKNEILWRLLMSLK